MYKGTFFVIGVNGVGKTTTLFFLKELLPENDFAVHDFDERGVPDNAGKDWRKDETTHWLETGEKNKKSGTQTVICGFAKPEEIEEMSKEASGKPFVILLDANAQTIAERIRSRYQDEESVNELLRTTGKTVEKFTMDNIYYSTFLRESCLKHRYEIIHTDKKTPNEVSHEVSALILKNV